MKIGKCLLVPPEEFSGEQKRRDQVQKINGECIVAPPEEIPDEQKLRGLAATQMEWARPNDVPCVILTLSRLRDYPGQDTAYSLRIIT